MKPESQDLLLSQLDACVCGAALAINVGKWFGMVDGPGIQWSTALLYKTEEEAEAAAQRLLEDVRERIARSELEESA